ncbi:MAG: glycosyltransferase family 2 protein [Ignavibacteriaceae bacterium]
MQKYIEYLFFIILFLIIHTYLIYPVIITIISLLKSGKDYKNYSGKVSVILSAYNEEKVIEARIKNLSELNFDFNKLEVLVGSDNSTDGTNEILKFFSEKYSWLNIRLFPKRRGKASVLNDLVKETRNEILVFTDANTRFDKDALLHLVSGFSDESIGGICGRLVMEESEISKTHSVEEGFYWKYETFFKKAEGKCDVLIGANGGIYAIRRSLFSSIPTRKAVTDDLYLTLSVLNEGKKFIYDYNAVAFEDVALTVKDEFNRKIRFAATNYQTIFNFKKRLFTPGLLSYSLWSHKIIRWLMPILMLVILALNIIIMPGSVFFEAIFYLQVIFYLMGIAGFIFASLNLRIRLFSLVYFFLISNLALLIGLLRFLRGKHSAVWQSTPR